MPTNTTDRSKIVSLGSVKQNKEDNERLENVERLKNLLQAHINTLTEDPFAFDTLIILAVSDEMTSTQYAGNMNYYEVIGAMEACKYAMLSSPGMIEEL